jgi:hypothetical protein
VPRGKVMLCLHRSKETASPPQKKHIRTPAPIVSLLRVSQWAARGLSMASMLDDPEHWRKLAQDARTRAAHIEDPAAKRTLEGIAASYDQLADRAAQRGKKKS